MTMLLPLFLFVGLFIGFIFGLLVCHMSTEKLLEAGTLRIDTSDPDEDPRMFLELSKSVNDIWNEKDIRLKVNNKPYLDDSQN